jgi:hypothetical protein
VPVGVAKVGLAVTACGNQFAIDDAGSCREPEDGALLVKADDMHGALMRRAGLRSGR